jgi:IclR family pca regulon transcriptional regulator
MKPSSVGTRKRYPVEPPLLARARGTRRVGSRVSNGRASHANGRRPEFVESLEKGLLVMRAFDAAHPSMTLSEVAARATLTRAAARRHLHTLSALGYAIFDGKRFALTPRVLELGFSYLKALGLPQIVRPYLERISAALGESASVAVLDGHDVVYVERVSTRRIMSIDLGVGARLPAVATSMGRVLLAGLPIREREARIASTELVAHTPHTVTSKARLRALLLVVERRGYCLVDEELEEGLRSIAVPLVDGRGRVVAAMNVSAQANRIGVDVMKRTFLAALRQAAEEVGRHPFLSSASLGPPSSGRGL